MARPDFLKLKQQLHQALMGHDLDQVPFLFKSIDLDSVPLEHAAELARLARQAHLYRESLQILNPHVYGVKKPSFEISLEYASGLRKWGMIHQCLQLLERMEDRSEKWLHEAFCHIHHWDYQKALQSLHKYLQTPLSEYQRIVAGLNLISALIFQEDHSAALLEIDKLMPVCKEKYHQYSLNLMELKGQAHLGLGQTEQALKILKLGQKQAKTQTGNTSLFLEKWLWIATVENSSAASLKDISAFKAKVRKAGHWETLRDLDYHLAKSLGDNSLMNHVYFGTPFTAYKDRIKKNTAQFFKTYLWHIPEDSVQVCLDPMQTNSPIFAFARPQHHLLMLLLSDFYRPFTVARIFDSLFTNEIFDPVHSPKRIYSLVNKLQEQIKTSGAPFELASTVNGYRFRLKSGGGVQFYPEMLFTSPEKLLEYSIKHKYHLHHFNASELGKVLEISPHKSYRWIARLEEEGALEVDPSSKRYKWKAS